jgi:hypothetical protein
VLLKKHFLIRDSHNFQGDSHELKGDSHEIYRDSPTTGQSSGHNNKLMG